MAPRFFLSPNFLLNFLGLRVGWPPASSHGLDSIPSFVEFIWDRKSSFESIRWFMSQGLKALQPFIPNLIHSWVKSNISFLLHSASQISAVSSDATASSLLNLDSDKINLPLSISYLLTFPEVHFFLSLSHYSLWSSFALQTAKFPRPALVSQLFLLRSFQESGFKTRSSVQCFHYPNYPFRSCCRSILTRGNFRTRSLRLSPERE